MLKDQIIKCQDCKYDFAWTADEQEYFRQKGFLPPKRCPMCRAAFSEAQKDKFRGKIEH